MNQINQLDKEISIIKRCFWGVLFLLILVSVFRFKDAPNLIKANVTEGPLLHVFSKKHDESFTAVVMSQFVHTNYVTDTSVALTNKNGIYFMQMKIKDVETNEFPYIIYRRGTNVWAAEMFKVRNPSKELME